MTFKIKKTGRLLSIESKELKLQLNHLRGLALHSLTFKQVHPEPLLGTLEQGFYNDIRLGSDFYSAHSVMELPARHKITDLTPCDFKSKKNRGELSIESEIRFGDGKLKKTFILSTKKPELKIRYHFSLNTLPICTLRTAFLTLNPDAFDRESLYYACHNGGDDLELFHLKNSEEIEFGRAVSGLVSSHLVLGNTKGYLEFGDAKKKIILRTEPWLLAALPMLHFLNLDEAFLLRFFFSLREIDETSLLHGNTGKQELLFEILLHAENHDSI